MQPLLLAAPARSHVVVGRAIMAMGDHVAGHAHQVSIGPDKWRARSSRRERGISSFSTTTSQRERERVTRVSGVTHLVEDAQARQMALTSRVPSQMGQATTVSTRDARCSSEPASPQTS
jgi:hypothetical protein